MKNLADDTWNGCLVCISIISESYIHPCHPFRMEKSDARLNILRADYKFPVAHASPCAPRPLPLRTGRTVQTAAETCMHAPPPITAMCGPAWGVGEYTGGKRPV